MSKHKPTEEQQAVIDCNPDSGDVIAVKAFAGTGKTSCLVMFAEAHPRAKILYLAYNRSMREDAEKRFPRNTVCKTTHQLCWREFGQGYKYAGKLGNMKKKQIADMMPSSVVRDRKHKWENVKAIDQTLKNFIYSADMKITKDHIPSWVKASRIGGSDSKTKKPNLTDSEIIENAEILWNAQTSKYDHTAKIDHDGYLKLYQLSKPTLMYDIILYDEAQDANPATLDIVMRQKHAGIICVGDPYQQMYAFRGSENAFDNIQATQTFKLTNSFRFGDDTAYLATKMLATYFGEEDTIKGRGPDTSINSMGYSIEQEAGAENAVYIARTNGNLLKRAIQAMDSGYTFGFSGGFNTDVFWTVKAIQDLKSGKFVSHDFIGLFDSFSDLNEYAIEANEREILSYIGLLKTYGPAIITKMNEIKDEETSFEKAQVKLITAHKSKGLEFPEIWMAEDFVPQEKEIDGVMKTYLPPEEVNILYVTVTRGINKVMISRELSDFMKDEGIIDREETDE